MNPDYRGYKTIWANDEKQVKKYVTQGKPFIIIESINEISKAKRPE
tara:strand:+ start:511 stop:648 length:138 start_codon:yes stop_codon:yes gene_type:complete